MKVYLLMYANSYVPSDDDLLGVFTNKDVAIEFAKNDCQLFQKKKGDMLRVYEMESDQKAIFTNIVYTFDYPFTFDKY